ncbi:IPExxxVDY family protein [Flammeovirgaceae bacterium SG7u.111]|nr:IPExxxVDY family protein [Flammeovirgaceae bacterium SG7u.132]WPO36634.1 IPExxxVDY family protein [Flammeovirgaceae bacterium SG7u.111]
MTEKLELEILYEFELIGIASFARPYKMAWELNRALDIRLVKVDDLELNFLNEQFVQVLNFYFATVHNTFRLIKNKSVFSSKNIKPYILPELESFDFFLVVENQTGYGSIDDSLQVLSEIPIVQYVKKFDANLLKSKDNLMF